LDRAEARIDVARIREADGLLDAVSGQLGDDPSHQWARLGQLRARALHLEGQGAAALDPAAAALRRAQDEHLEPRCGAALRIALAQALLVSGQARAARPLRVQALGQYETAQVGLSPRVADALVGLGRADPALGHAASALDPLKRAHEFWQQFDSNNLWAAEAAYWYGRALQAAGQEDAGQNLVSQARLLRSPFAVHQQLAGAAGVSVN